MGEVQKMKKLISAIKSIFPAFNESQLRDDMTLDSIPNWDSMVSVDFQLELESAFGINLSDIQFNGKSTISDMKIILRNKGISI